MKTFVLKVILVKVESIIKTMKNKKPSPQLAETLLYKHKNRTNLDKLMNATLN